MLVKREHEILPIRSPKIPVGRTCFAIVDPDDFKKESHYYWRAVLSSSCIYAIRRTVHRGKTTAIRMHCEIMQTPEGMECHHKNLNSLDNRKSNLENLTPSEHRAKHAKI